MAVSAAAAFLEFEDSFLYLLEILFVGVARSELKALVGAIVPGIIGLCGDLY